MYIKLPEVIVFIFTWEKTIRKLLISRTLELTACVYFWIDKNKYVCTYVCMYVCMYAVWRGILFEKSTTCSYSRFDLQTKYLLCLISKTNIRLKEVSSYQNDSHSENLKVDVYFFWTDTGEAESSQVTVECLSPVLFFVCLPENCDWVCRHRNRFLNHFG
jgi:hypothetical protein